MFQQNSFLHSLRAGFAGACALNALHEAARVTLPNAPRVDQIGMRAIDKILIPKGIVLSQKNLRKVTFLGDVISNTIYYAAISKVSNSKNHSSVWKWATILGLGAGIGAVVLPPKMGLGQQPSRNFPVTASLTVLWYLAGSLVTAGVLNKSKP